VLGAQRAPQGYTVPPEMKTRAGRFVHAMETSDAFRYFKKYGISAKIGEFDFRDLLLCTMESSGETLKRNLEQFKEYSGIYDRQDLLTFLNFCEDRFSYLLNTDHKRPLKQVQKEKIGTNGVRSVALSVAKGLRLRCVRVGFSNVRRRWSPEEKGF